MGDVCGPLAVIGHGDHSRHYSDFSAHVTIKVIAITMLSFSDHLRKSSCMFYSLLGHIKKSRYFLDEKRKELVCITLEFFLNFA